MNHSLLSLSVCLLLLSSRWSEPPSSAARPCGAASEARRASPPPCATHAARGDSAPCARSGGGEPAPPAFASPLFFPPPPLAACARARRSPRQRRARGARVSRKGRPVTHAAPARSRPCGEPPPRADPEAPCALSRRCALLASFFCLSLVVAPRARRSAPEGGCTPESPERRVGAAGERSG